MKRLTTILFIALLSTFVAKSMNYDEARQRAWFLTDKMAYELNLTPEQYDRAYEINLNYFLSINTASDCYGAYWNYRNADFRYVLFDWQYSLFSTLDYFFRPIRWVRTSWYYPVFDRYRAGYYYFDRPAIYLSYRGWSWRRRGHNDVSPYRNYFFRPGRGMRDNYHGSGPRPPYRPGHSQPGRPDHDRPNYGRPDNDRPNYGRPDNGRPNYGRPGSGRPGSGSNQGGSSRPNTGRPQHGSRPSQRTGSQDRPSRNFGGQRTESRRSGNGRSTAQPSRSSGRSSGTSRGTRTFGR